ncbi:MAG TPA: S1 RNA-binding domain-containing protein [Anaerolineae bacterium]|nr:S1 RNA-binding domain-containing protein [Anaerolineae bacterium]
MEEKQITETDPEEGKDIEQAPIEQPTEELPAIEQPEPQPPALEQPVPEPLATEQPVADQPEEHPMSALMAEDLSFRKLKPGDITEGVIVSVTPTEVLVDVGAKSEGIVPSKELERLGRDGLESLKVGDKVFVYVIRSEDREGNLLLSLRRAEEEKDWVDAERLHSSQEAFEGQVAGFNKGGLIVRMGKLRGFVPASQLGPEHQGSDKQQPEERWARLVGQTIHAKVIEIDRKRKRLILSERAAVREWRDSQKKRLLEELRVGEVRTGIVTSLSDFGAFVDLGGADGLIHLSELSWDRSAKPRDIFKIGQKVEVYVLGVDREKKRIALSRKRLEPEPWTTVEDRYYVGQLVEAVITRLAPFGAFALVNGEIEGLVHVSELSEARINTPQEVVHEGDKHVMRIIRIEARKRRMGLSIRRVADPAYADLDWRAELEGERPKAKKAEEPEEEPVDEEEADEEELEGEFEDEDLGEEDEDGDSDYEENSDDDDDDEEEDED